MTDLNVSPDPAGARPRYLRRGLVTSGLLGALLVGGVALPATASAAVPAAHPAMTSMQIVPMKFCPLGRQKGHRGCRGGSLGAAVRDNGYTIATNVGCGVAGIGATAVTANPAVGFGVGVGCGVLLDDEPAG
jgi:hypothetical protein